MKTKEGGIESIESKLKEQKKATDGEVVSELKLIRERNKEKYPELINPRSIEIMRLQNKFMEIFEKEMRAKYFGEKSKDFLREAFLLGLRILDRPVENEKARQEAKQADIDFEEALKRKEEEIKEADKERGRELRT